MNTKLFKILLVGAIWACGFSMRVMANSTALAPGASVALATATTSPGATLLVSENDGFSGAKIQGYVNVTVLSGFTDNPWAASGGLTFVYQIFSSKSSVDSITGMGIDGWTGFSTDVADYPYGTFAPSFATRSNDGDTVTFGWQNPSLGTGLILPGSSSFEFLIYTDATSYVDVTAGVRDGDATPLITLGPAVPDGGTTALLLGLGLLGMGLIRRARKS